MEYIIQLLMAFLGSLGFGALYNIHGRKLLIAALGGLLAWAVYLLVNQFTPSPYPCAFLGSVALTIYAELVARWQKAPTTMFLVTATIPLIPGAGLYRTVSAMMIKDAARAASQGTYTLLFAASMASGITLTTLVFHLMMTRAHEYHHRHS